MWDYSTDELKIDPSNIILFGESLGCSVVTWLGQELISKDKKLPKGIIIQSGFYSLKDIASDLFTKYITYLLKSKFENFKYIKKINNKIPLLIIHSLKDELININHSYKLIKECKIDREYLLIVDGIHSTPNYSDQEFTKLKNFITN